MRYSSKSPCRNSTVQLGSIQSTWYLSTWPNPGVKVLAQNFLGERLPSGRKEGKLKMGFNKGSWLEGGKEGGNNEKGETMGAAR